MRMRRPGGSDLGDGGQDVSLAGAGRGHQQRRLGTAAIGHPQIADGLLLVGAEVQTESAALR